MINLRDPTSSHGLEILYEDKELFSVNKPALIHSVELPPSYEESEDEGEAHSGSVAGKLLPLFPELGTVSPQVGDAGLVQRLDFETSGLLLGAKTRATWERVREAFKHRGAEKHYLVVLSGNLRSSSSIDAPIGSPYRRAGKVRVYLPGKKQAGKNRAQEAQSDFFPIARDPKGNWTLARVEARTGRRHQVRAHAAALGHPLLGDSLYGSTALFEVKGEKIPSFALHAARLELEGVGTFEAPCPAYFGPFLAAVKGKR